MKKHCLKGLLLGLCLSSTLIAQIPDYQSQSIDSLIQWLSQEVYNNPEGFQQIAWYVVDKSETSGDLQNQALAHEQLGTWHYYHGIFGTDSSFFHDQKVVDLYLQIGDKAKLAKAYDILSTDYINLAKYKEAQEYVFKALSIFEELKDEQGIADAYHNLSTIYELLEDLPEAIRYGNLSVDKFMALEAPVSAAIVHFNLSKAYSQQKDFDNALKSAQASVDLIETYGKEEDKYAMLRAYTFRGEVYQEMGNYKAARQDFDYLLQKAEEIGGQNLVDGYSSTLGNLLRVQGQYKEALPYILATLEHSKAFMNQADLWEQYSQIRECYQGIGNYEKALEYASLAAEARDSMLNGRIGNLESELEAKYQSAQQEATIEEQQEQLGQQQKIQFLFIGLFVLAALLLAVVYFNYRNNQKVNQELNTLNEKLSHKVDENELLLKEIHHRVKNNLQVISSLLSLHSETLEDTDAKGAMTESKNRVRSMALIHQKLYQGKNLAAIEMKDYFQNLGASMLDSFGIEKDTISIQYPMSQLELDVDTAIPVGLIVNELLTNSLKYAFTPKTKGEIQISLSSKDEHTFELMVKDNGLHQSQQSNVDNQGFGSQLIQLLALQLEGQIQKNLNAGTEIILEFKSQRAA